MNTIKWEDFSKIDIRTGTIIQAEEFPEARNPSYILHIDFGDFGIKKSSAQITDLYKTQDLIGQSIIAVINFPPKQIGPIMSECLVLGSIGKDGEVTLLQTESKTQNGLKIS